MSKRKHGHEDRGKRLIDTLLEASRIVRSGMDLQKTLDLLLEQLEMLIEFDSASILVRSGDGFSIATGRGYPVTTDILGHVFNPAENPVIRDIVASRLPTVIPDVAKHPGWQTLESTKYIRSWMGVPLLYKEGLVGLLSVDKGQPHFFNDRTAKLARAFANHAAIAIAIGQTPEPETRIVGDNKVPLIPRGAVSIAAPRPDTETAAFGEGREALLFGRILVQNGLATDTQVAEAMNAQRQLQATGIPMKLGAIMFEKGFISVDTLCAALMIQEERFAIDTDPYALHRQGLTPEVDSLLGEWAVERGLVTRENLQEALTIQQSIRALGVKSKRVGEILVDKGYLNSNALVKLLEERKAAEIRVAKDTGAAAPSPSKLDMPAAVETAPTRPIGRKAAYERELRAAGRRLIIGVAAVACCVVALVWTLAHFRGSDEDSRRRVRVGEELMGYAVPGAAVAAEREPTPRGVVAEEPTAVAALTSPLSALEEARKALAESVARGSSGRAVMLARPFFESGQRLFLLEGKLPFAAPCQGTATVFFDGRDIPGVSAPVQPQPNGFSAALGPIHAAKKIAGGVYTVRVDLSMDLGGDPTGAIMYVPDSPDAVRPPAVSFPLRFSFYLPGEDEGREYGAAAAGFLRAFVKNAEDVVAGACAARDELERTDDIRTAWPGWEKGYATAVARLNAMREELAAFEAAYLACPYAEAAAAVRGLLETASSCMAELNTRLAEKAGVLPERTEPSLGATTAVALAPPAGEKKDVAALLAAGAEETENVITVATTPERRTAARSTEFLAALRGALLSAGNEMLGANRWLKDEATRRKNQYAQMLATAERYIGLWKSKVESLSSLDPSMAKLAAEDAGRDTFSRLMELAEQLAEAGVCAMIDNLYDFGFVPSAEVAALVQGAAAEGKTPHAERIEEILQDLTAVRVGE